jgi:hypothetical protein
MRKMVVKFDIEEHPPKEYLIYLTSAQLHRIMTAAIKEMEKHYDGLLVTDVDIAILPKE